MKYKNFLIIIVIVFNLNIILATITIGNLSNNLSTYYGPSETLKGWINISIANESASTRMIFSGQEISIKDFLDLNKPYVYYTCFPPLCEMGYSTVGNKNNSKTFSIPESNKKLFGIKITGEISSIDDISFDLSSNAGKSCINPIQIDFLDDGLVEWKADNVSTDQCYIEKPYGCFVKTSTSPRTTITTNSLYCEKTEIPPVKGFLIGAKLNGTGTADLKFSIKAGINEESCEAYINQTGFVGCTVELAEELEDFTNAEFCMQLLDSNGTYNISYEDADPCGSIKDISSEDSYAHDYEIFISPLKFNSFKKATINRQLIIDKIDLDIKDSLYSYITSEYNKNCTPQCIIPISIISGINQQTTVSNLLLTYKVKGNPTTEASVYEIRESAPFISTDGFIRLDIEDAGFLVPQSYGENDITINMGDKQIEKKIQISKNPIIKQVVYPSVIPALVKVPFIVLIDGDTRNLTYKWDFEGSEIETTTNTFDYDYSETGDFELTVTVSNKYGSTIKTVPITVVSPRQGINKTIADYRENLKNLSSQVNQLPEWVKKEIDKSVNVEDLNNQLKKLEDEYKNTLSTEDEENTRIMRELLALKIPIKITSIEKIKPITFFPNEEQINFNILDELGAGTTDEGDRTKYSNAINNWILEYLNVSVESNSYGAYYKSGENEIFFSDIKVRINAKQDVGEFYFVVNGNPDTIKFDPQLTTKDFDENQGVSMTFSEMGGGDTNELEFLYPERVDISNLPFSISPEFKELSLVGEIGICNHNRKCESGETYKNCRDDCKPWSLTITYLIILFICALIVYIALQEWYKRNYESSLFLNKNQLFNLISYMNNSQNQGIKKSDVFSKLVNEGWTKEQLEYAWRKFKGERTGMWEIPVFKWFENRKVKEELEKRKKQAIK